MFPTPKNNLYNPYASLLNPMSDAGNTPGLFTFPNGSYAANPYPTTAQAGNLGTFGAMLPQKNFGPQPFTMSPSQVQAPRTYTTNQDDWYQRLKNIFPGQGANPPTGGRFDNEGLLGTTSTTLSGSPLIGGGDKENAGMNPDKWVQLGENAYRYKAGWKNAYGVRGDKWKVIYSGGMALTVPDKGGMSKSDKRKERGLGPAPRRPGSQQANFRKSVMSWRLATG